MNKLQQLIKRQTKTDTYWGTFLRSNGYPENLIDSTATKLEKLPVQLREALIKWDTTGILPDIEEEGFSIKELVEYAGLNEIAAFLMIDWLRREPVEAKSALAEPLTKISVDEKCVDEIIRAEEMDESCRQ